MTDKETIGDFDVEIEGKRITAVHRKHGHQYVAYWETDPPHLRNASCRPNDKAERGHEGFERDAGEAMRLKLERDELI
jgi:hypothetical protein